MVAAYTLVAIAVCCSANRADAAAAPDILPNQVQGVSLVTKSLVTKSLVTEPPSLESSRSHPTVHPEMLLAQAVPTETAAVSSSDSTDSTDSTDPRYYQDYQSVVVPTTPVPTPASPSASTPVSQVPSQIAPPPPPVLPPPPSISAPPSSTPPSSTPSSQPLRQPSQPIPPFPATAPSQPSAPVQVPGVPDGGNAPLPPAPPPASLNLPSPMPPTASPNAPPPITAPGELPPPPATSSAPIGNGRSPATGDLALLVTDVKIVGVEPDLQAYGLEIIQTKPGGQTNNAQLQNDVLLLQKSGFFSSASVTSQTNPQGLSVTFYAAPVILQALQLPNAKALNQSVVNTIFKDQFGKPISPAALNQSVQQINAWYAQNGYSLARVISLQPTLQGIIVVEVAEGRVGDVKLRYVTRDGKDVDAQGNPIRPRSQEAFVRRQIKIHPGDVFQTSQAQEDLRRLADLGIFESYNVTFEGDARNTTVVYNLTERPPRDLRFGGGYNDTLGLFGTINLQDVNFGGLGQRLGGTVLVGTKDVQFDARFVSPYRDTEPKVPGYNVNVYRQQGLSSVFDDNVNLPNGDRVRERRYGIGAGLEKPLGAGWNGNLGANYANVSTRDSTGKVFATDSLGNPLTLSGTGIDDLFSVSFTAVRDLRDRPLNPSKGSITRFNTEQYFPIGRGQALGTKLEATYTEYVPIKLITAAQKAPGSPTQTQPEVLVLNVQGGTWIGSLPPYNAFVLGGPNSVRGWDTGSIATPRSYIQADAEYRFPIYKFIGGAAFVDFASDLGTDKDVLGQPGVVRDKPGTGLGVGFGVRVNSPFGILRGDLGVSNQGDVRFQFGFGQRF